MNITDSQCDYYKLFKSYENYIETSFEYILKVRVKYFIYRVGGCVREWKDGG